MDIAKEFKLPFYVKVSILVIGLFTFITTLYLIQDIVVPLVFAIIIAIVLHPVVNFFVRLKIKRVLAITITLFITFLIIGACGILLFSQASKFADSWPIFLDKSTDVLNQIISWTATYFDINPWKIHVWLTKTQNELLYFNGAAVGQTLVTIGGWLVVLFLIPVYVFIILYYKPLLIEFIHRIFSLGQQNQVSEIVTQTKTVIQRYLVGLVIEAVLVATLDIVALLALGIEYALLLGIIGAFLNIIPYIGGLVAVALPMIVALATKSTAWYALYVLVAYYIIQLIDNNYFVPIIVSSKVKINALFSIIAVIAGNALWGISGMFLAIPLLAIIKLIFDHIESLKPWGFLLGDSIPHKSNLLK